MSGAPVVWSLEAAVSAFLSHGYSDGDLISHDWLAWALDLPDNATRDAQFVIMDRIDQFKNALLLEHSIYIVSSRGKGYQIVPPSDQCFVATSQAMREVSRQFRLCQKRLKHTRMELLSTEESKRHTDTQVRLAGLSSMLDKGKRDVFKQFRIGEKP